MIGVAAQSIGPALDVASADVGVVHSVFSHAVNLLVRGDLWTVLAAAKPDLPFGIRAGLPNFDGLGLQAGDSVNIRAGFVGLGQSRLVVDCRSAPRWIPTFENNTAPAHGITARMAIIAGAARGRAWSGSAELARMAQNVLQRPSDLGAALAQVVGCGPGATPSGDDVLVGVLAVLTSPKAGAAGAGAAESLCRSLPSHLLQTTDLSAHLLRQAARGLFSRPVHELVSALISDSSSEQMQEAVQRVVETGATSGADTCAGLLEIAPHYFIPSQEKAAA